MVQCLIAESTRVSATSTELLESEEFNPPVRDDSADVFTDQSTNPSVRDESAKLFTDQSANPPVSEQSASLFADQSTVYDPPAQRQPVIEESSIEGPVPVPVEPVNKPLAFEIVEGGSERGKRKLIDSWGYSYNVKRQRVSATDWQCTVRQKVRNYFFSLKHQPQFVYYFY